MDGDGRQPDARRAVGEALRVRTVRGVECGLACRRDLGDAAVEDVGRGEQGQARVVMVVVVPAEEVAEPGAAMERRVEAAGVVGLVLEGLELGLAVRVVVGDARAAKAARGAERIEELGERVALDRKSVV